MTKFLKLEKQSNFMAEPLNTNPSSSKEVDDDMIEPTASLAHTPHVPYEVRTEGPLTYFHYYFEEVDATVDATTGIPQNPAAKFLPNRYLVGAGVLTVTALSGLALADINKSQVSAKPNSPEPTVQQNSPKATDSTKRLNLIGTGVHPVQTHEPVWSNQPSPDVSKTSIAKLTAGTTATQPSLEESSKPLTTGQPNALNTSPLSTLSQPLRLKPLSLPNATSRMSVAQKPEPVAASSQAERQSKPAVPQMLQPTELQPSFSPQSPSQATLPLENKGTPGTQAAGISLPETSAPQAPNESTRAQPPASLPAQSLPRPLMPSPAMSQGNQRLETSLPKQVENNLQPTSSPALSEKQTAKESVEALNAPSVLPQSIQDLLDRSRSLPDKVVTLVPLTKKAAEAVSAMNKVGLVTNKAERFTILHLNLQDYQQAWLARKIVAQPLALTEAFPTYGFVDYQKRIIAVLDQKQPLRTSLRVSMLSPAK